MHVTARTSVVVLLAIISTILIVVACHPTGVRSDEAKSAGRDSAATTKTGPQYTAQGELKRPAGYETWVFVGSNLGLEYSDDASKAKPPATDREKKSKTGNFHNVYINPEAYAHYVKTGTFPENTVLILDIFKAEEREPRNIVTEGTFPAAQSGLAVAVKNSARPDGSKTDWAYYDFGLDRQSAKAFPDKACYDCHIEHADDDNVWVQFYPTLRKYRDARARK
jgi:hypothetical protein